jgi:hypothetical protein
MRKQGLDELLELFIAKIFVPIPHSDDDRTIGIYSGQIITLRHARI